ncbi:MAG: HAMP domain-containing protein [Burkholderiaceae bacterium]|nr:HAMP domain-containing protein [Burkholderiaceae bacterium]
MALLRRLSIRNKLMLAMGLCLLLFIFISSSLSVYMTSENARTRVVEQELPAQIGEIRNDILRQIIQPLSVSQTLANDTFLHEWEEAGLPEEGVAAWEKYAKHIKAKNNAATVFWVSHTTGKYYTDTGYDRTLSKDKASDQWFYGFVNGSAPYTLDIDKDVSADKYMLFINTRVQTTGGKQAVAGLGLAVNTLADTIRGYKLGKSGSVALVRPTGAILVHRNPALVDGKHFLKELPGYSADLSKELLGGQQFAHGRFKGENGMQFVASSFIPELNAYVVAEVPESEVLGNIGRAAMISALVGALIGGGIGMAAIFFVASAIAAPVSDAAAMLTEIASGEGDLSRRMPVESDDEVGALAHAFNKFVSSLNSTMLQVRNSTAMISTASSEIASGNFDLSSRTEHQASNLEETAAAMEQLTSTVKQNSANAEAANKLVAETTNAAVKGGQVVAGVVDMMGQITSSSQKMSDIIGVIDGIAFQTNILALNAAVEAARAGEQGRGFAVVASEVRSLAQRSAAAAKEIKELIVDSVGKVEAGGKLVDTAGDAMSEIVKSVQHVATLMAEITTAGHEQSEGIGQVNLSITQMDDATQQNAALVEEAAAAAQSLQEQAAQLEQVIGTFKLDTSGGGGGGGGGGAAAGRSGRTALALR